MNDEEILAETRAHVRQVLPHLRTIASTPKTCVTAWCYTASDPVWLDQIAAECLTIARVLAREGCDELLLKFAGRE